MPFGIFGRCRMTWPLKRSGEIQGPRCSDKRGRVQIKRQEKIKEREKRIIKINSLITAFFYRLTLLKNKGLSCVPQFVILEAYFLLKRISRDTALLFQTLGQTQCLWYWWKHGHRFEEENWKLKIICSVTSLWITINHVFQGSLHS